jgi:hypothetical protein
MIKIFFVQNVPFRQNRSKRACLLLQNTSMKIFCGYILEAYPRVELFKVLQMGMIANNRLGLKCSDKNIHYTRPK